MKVREAIDKADRLKPNAISDNDKYGWLSDIEGKVRVMIHHEPLEALASLQVPGNDQTELVAPYPFEELYVLYLCAQIDYANGEYTKYQNSAKAANDAFREYHKWYIRNKHKCWQNQCGGAEPYADNPI